MQVIQTSVRAPTEDRAGLSVDFTGEGGEAISVRLSEGSQYIDDGDAIAKARALLVQVATFDASRRDSEGNDEFAVAESHDETPQDYRSDSIVCVLEYGEGEHVRSTPEVALPDADAVRAEVERSAVDLVRSAQASSDENGWAVRAVDTHGNIITSVTFAEARMLAEISSCSS